MDDFDDDFNTQGNLRDYSQRNLEENKVTISTKFRWMKI
jgi:hypothetical protein